jgi:hypothetical protein
MDPALLVMQAARSWGYRKMSEFWAASEEDKALAVAVHMAELDMRAAEAIADQPRRTLVGGAVEMGAGDGPDG